MDTTFHSSDFGDNDFYSIKLPEYRKPKLELWAFMSLNDLDALLTCFDSTEFLKSSEPKSTKLTEYQSFVKLITKQLDIKENSPKEQILIDKYFYLVKFCLQNDFSKAQINCLLLIIKRTHDLAIETSFGNLDETFDYFKNLLIINSVHRPPYSLHVFSVDDIKLITDYVFDVYFKQFKFYKYVFSLAVRLDIKFKYANLPKAPTPNEEVKNEGLVSGRTTDNKEFIQEPSEVNSKVGETIEEAEEENKSETTNLNGKWLKEYVRTYLHDELKKMKDLLNSELSGESNVNNAKPTNAKKK